MISKFVSNTELLILVELQFEAQERTEAIKMFDEIS